MNISSGMRAAEGAIEDVEITSDGIRLNVIGNEEPIGICGSGILAVVKELLKVGLVRKEGAFIKLKQLGEDDYRCHMMQQNGIKREFILTESPEKLLITQGDIRQVQLAKGAILSGFIALLDRAGIRMEDLDKVMIAGQFGAHLPADSLVGTGILPKEVKEAPGLNLDQAFLIKATNLIKKNLGKEFNVDDLCQEMGMSRSSLYNKIKALTDHSPSDFVRQIRMTEAATLLKSKKYTVAEVSDMMGYSDPKYFTDIFKKHYGMTPSAYMKQP